MCRKSEKSKVFCVFGENLGGKRERERNRPKKLQNVQNSFLSLLDNFGAVLSIL